MRTKTRWVRNDSSGILTRRQRLWAWIGFLATALMAPLAAHLIEDASWLFSLCVSGLVATVIVVDDRSRRPAGARGE
jgi:cell division protein FtsW (lipid II flippase)